MYQALYRKWRPRTFDDVIGQPHITETLKNQVRTGRTSHAYLFIGTRGTGKTTCAKILAKAVNCENPVDGNPCNCCRICRGIDDGSVMDVVEMDAASNNGVDNVRQLRDEAVFSPATAKKRVYIVDEVHMLSGAAFNALLKILEEPPEHLMFILATTELNKVPATILSRCQRHSFRRLDVESIVARLEYVAAQEGIDLTPDAAKLLAVRSEGGMRDALSMLDQCAGRERIDPQTVYSALGLAGNREIAALLRQIAAHDSGGALAGFDRLWRDGKDPATLLGELASLLRDLLLDAVAPKNGRALRSGSFDDAILDGFRGVFSTEKLVEHITTIQGALADARSGQAKMRCELTLIALCDDTLSDSLPALRARVAALEQAVRGGAALPAPAGRDAHIAPEAEETASVGQPVAGPGAPEAAAVENDTSSGAVAPPSPQGEGMGTPAPVGQPVAGPGAPESAAAENDTTSGAVAPLSPQGEGMDGELWERVRAQLGDHFPIGTATLLSDDLQVTVRFAQDTLSLAIRNEFAKNMIDRPDVLAALAQLATQTAGRPVQVRSVSPDAPEMQRSAEELNARLDALKQFDIVQFK